MEKDKLQSQKKWNEMTKKEKAKNIGCLSIIAILVIAAIFSLIPPILQLQVHGWNPIMTTTKLQRS